MSTDKLLVTNNIDYIKYFNTKDEALILNIRTSYVNFVNINIID